MSACCQQRNRGRQDNCCKHPHSDPRRRSFRSRLRCRIRPLEQDIENDGNGKRRPPEVGDPPCGVDPGAKQSVRGKGTGKGERVRDEKQCSEDVAGGQDGQGSRPKDRGLGVKQGGGDQLAEKHDGVDHRDERIDFAQSNVTHRQYQESGSEQQADDCETEPDLPAGSAVYRTAPDGPATRIPLKANMRRWGSKQVSLSRQASAIFP